MPSHLRRYDQPGDIHFWTISCLRRLTFFHDDGMKKIVVDALEMLQVRLGICLIAYVVMPDHVHVLLYPHRRGCDVPSPIADVLHAFKQHVGFHGKERLRNIWRSAGNLWSEPLNQWARGAFHVRSIWTVRGYDFNVRDEDTLRTKIDYCHKNPLTRGLAERAEDWRWSSYRFYELGDSSLLAMNWNGRWPIEW